jgi:hypothetical protein
MVTSSHPSFGRISNVHTDAPVGARAIPRDGSRLCLRSAPRSTTDDCRLARERRWVMTVRVEPHSIRLCEP